MDTCVRERDESSYSGHTTYLFPEEGAVFDDGNLTIPTSCDANSIHC